MRLIDANALLKQAYYEVDELVVDVADIEDAPTVEAVEVVHGRWLNCDGDPVPFMRKREFDGCPERSCFCSVCGDWLTGSDEYPCVGKYCPNCGAKMGGGNDNGQA